MLRNKLYIGVLGVLLLAGACKEADLGPDPYAGGKEPLGIRFAESLPSPSQGREGTEMTFKVYGIGPYKDKLQFLINGIEANISTITDSTITAVLPENVSTGGTRLVVDGQIYPGPLCKVIGKVDLDPTFNAGAGTNGTIGVIRQLSNGAILLGGYFTDYNGVAASADINGLVRINANGGYVKMSFGEGVKEGYITSIHALSNNDLLVSGSFTTFDTIKLVNNITRLNATGSLQVEKVPVLNLTDDPLKSEMTVPTFNGGTVLPIMKSFVYGNTVTSLGGFSEYTDYYYVRSTVDNVLRGLFPVGGVVRTDLKGALDSTFNLDKSVSPVKARKGFEGFLFDGLMQADGKLIVVGRFNRYNNNAVTGNIVRINLDGSLDASFNTGAGANEAIGTIVATPAGKMLVTGSFSSFGGVPANGLALLNADGSVDPTFKSLGFTGGVPNFIRQLSNGKILVSGTFKAYGGIIREGLCILNADGTLAKGYNNTGKLDGGIIDALEGTNSLGQRTVTLVGTISSFNGKGNIGNIMRLVLQD